MIWRNPLAWMGLATLLVPIAIHLLVRQQAQPLAFPSLRFLPASRLAAVKRRRVSDWLLLALRLSILAAAAAALADPFLATASQRAAWAARTSRFIIVDTPGSASANASGSANARANAEAAAVRAETSSAFASAVYRTTDVRSGVTQALGWLAAAPPAAREIVIVSPLTRGRVTEAIGAQLPPHVGLRFTRVGGAEEERRVDGRPATVRRSSAVATRATGASSGNARADATDTFGTRTPAVTVHVDRTDVRWRASAGGDTIAGSPVGASVGATAAPPRAGGTIAVATESNALAVPALGLRVEAAPRDLPAARAALDAVLAEGVPVAGQASRPISIAIAVDAAPRPANPGTTDGAPTRVLTASWMAGALDAIANDDELHESLASAESASPRSGTRTRESSSIAGNAPPGDASSVSPNAARTPQTDGVTPIVLLRAIDGAPMVSAWATSVAAANAAAPTPRPATPDASTPTAANPNADDHRPALRLVSHAPADSDVTALLMRAALRAAADADPLPRAEVARIPDAELAAWQRPAALPPMDELTRVESHDRRWLWGAALALLLIERIVRARMRRREPERTEVAHAA